MASDIEQMRSDTAVQPTRQVDAVAVVRRGRRRRRWRQGSVGGVALSVVIAVVLVVAPSERAEHLDAVIEALLPS